MEEVGWEYVVVEFYEEIDCYGSVPLSVVPILWIIQEEDKQLCFWPPFKSEEEKKRAVVRKLKYDDKTCGKCPVNIKYKTISYENAVLKLKRLEESDNSSLSQSDVENEKKRRRLKPNTLYKDYFNNKAIESFSTDDDEAPPPVPKPGRFLMSNNSSEGESSTSKLKQSQMKSNTTSKDKVDLIPATATHSKYQSQNSQHEVDLDVTVVPTMVEHEPIVTFHELNSCCRKTKDLVTKALTKLEVLSSDIKFLIEIIQRTSVVENVLENPEIDYLPVTTNEQMINFNEKLKDDTYFINISSCLIKIGGKDVNDSTRRLLARIVDHSLSLEYNWSGRGKNSFQEMKNIIRLILVCLRKNPLTRNATEVEVTGIIKVWFRSALDRQGGRNRRRQKAI